MLLYLADAGPSLQTALQLITDFGAFSGLQINWDKSQILPLDFAVPTADQASLPLVRTDNFKYLGIQISRSLQDYIALNIEPLYSTLKTKTQIWPRLPLGVMGRINLVKMIILPKLLYIFWQAPLYIPQQIFKSMESILNTFIWGSSRHKLPWRVLKCPTDLCGAAVPDLFTYYVASQLSHFFYINHEDKERYSTLICSQIPGPISHPFQTLFCGSRGLPRAIDRHHMLFHHRKIWQQPLRLSRAPDPHSHTPLWNNPQLSEMASIPDNALWTDKGIIYLTQVMAWSNLSKP